MPTHLEDMPVAVSLKLLGRCFANSRQNWALNGALRSSGPLLPCNAFRSLRRLEIDLTLIRRGSPRGMGVLACRGICRCVCGCNAWPLRSQWSPVVVAILEVKAEGTLHRFA